MKIVPMNMPVQLEKIKDINYSQADLGNNPWVNLYTGRLKFAFEDLTIGGGNSTIAISHIYNSQINTEFAKKSKGFGKNWKLNLSQFLINDYCDKEGNRIFKYMDEMGEIHRLVAFSGGWYDDRNAKIVLKKVGDYYDLIDGIGNRLRFDVDGYLCYSFSCHSDFICKAYNYDDKNRLTSVYDLRTWVNAKHLAKTRIELEYDENDLLISMTSYGDFTKKLARMEYKYDSEKNLISVYKVAFNQSERKCLSKQILELAYKKWTYAFVAGDLSIDIDKMGLSMIIDCETQSAQMIQYRDHGEVEKVSSGIVESNYISLGMQDAYSNNICLGCGAESGAASERYFIEKSFNKYDYKYLPNLTYDAVEATIENEVNIKLSYFMDRKAQIISAFEKCNTGLKTLALQREKHWDNESSKTFGTINDNGTKLVKTGKLGGIQFFTELARSESEKVCKNFNYSFWLKTTNTYTMLEAKVFYKYTDVENTPIDKVSTKKEISTTVYLNPDANSAWQKVVLPITVPDGYSTTSLKYMEITFLADKKICTDDLYFNDIGFAPAPTSQMFLYQSNSSYWPLKELQKVTIDGSAINVSKDFYLTESDIIATFTNKRNSSQPFDLVYNNCTKRRSVNSSISFSFPLNIIVDGNRSRPFRIITMLPTGDAQVRTEYDYALSYFDIYNYYSKSVDGIKRTSTSGSRIDYKGKTLQSFDEYEVETDYYYDRYGNLTQVVVQNGSAAHVVQKNKYDEVGKLISSNDGLNGQSIEYDEADQICKQQEFYMSDNSEINTPHTVKNFFGIFCNKPIGTKEYDGQSAVGANQVTYENGRIRTVFDGTTKYGIQYDLVNDRIKYSQFEGKTEKLVQCDSVSKYWTDDQDDTGKTLLRTHTSSFYDGNGNKIGFTSADVDTYGKIQRIQRGNAQVYDYLYDSLDGKTFTESEILQKPHSRLNRTDNSRTDYRYDQDDNLIGWKEVENRKTVFEVKQIAPNTTKFIFDPTEEYYTEIKYDALKFDRPRITGVKIQYDKNSSIDRPNKLYNVSYQRNAFGRIDKKSSGEATFNYVYDTLGSKEILKGINYSRSDEQEMPMAGGGERKIKTKFDETCAYYANGLLKQSSLNYSRSTQTGTMTPVVKNGSNLKTYAYDNLHRITKEINSTIGLNRTFSYQADGRLKEIVDSNTGSKRYFYNSKGRLESINYSTHFSYDNYGNRTQKYDGSSTEYLYDCGGTLIKAGNTTYRYNADGVRCKKECNGTQTKYYLDGNKILGEDRPDCKLRYFYDVNGLALIRHIKGNYTNDYEVVLDSMGNVAMLVEIEEGHFGCRYEYDVFGKCHVLSLDGTRITNEDSIGIINPFRWKGYYYDSETGFYYANGSYYDPETGLYVDAAPIESVVENAFTTRCLDRNGIMCNNTLELAGSPFTVFNTQDLCMDPSYDPGQTWWEKAIQDVNNWWNGISVADKVCIGIIFVAASVCIAMATGGTSVGPEAELLSSITAASALASAAKVALIELSIGIGFAAAGWALNAAMTGSWDINALKNDIADAIFFTGLFMLISTSVNAIKYVYRADPYPVPTREAPDLGNKLDYAFGQATGRQHSVDRSRSMLQELEKIGIRDNAAGRSLLRENLIQAYYTPNNILGPGKYVGQVIKESFLVGPHGFLVVQSTWQKNVLRTIMFKR